MIYFWNYHFRTNSCNKREHLLSCFSVYHLSASLQITGLKYLVILHFFYLHIVLLRTLILAQHE